MGADVSLQDLVCARLLSPQTPVLCEPEERISGDDVWHRIMTDPRV